MPISFQLIPMMVLILALSRRSMVQKGPQNAHEKPIHGPHGLLAKSRDNIAHNKEFNYDRGMKGSKSLTLIEKCGYIQCQIEVTEHISLAEEKLMEEIKSLRKSIEQTKGLLAKQEKLSELCRLLGEADALRRVWRLVASLPCRSESSH